MSRRRRRLVVVVLVLAAVALIVAWLGACGLNLALLGAVESVIPLPFCEG